jgi:5'-nucleotidase
VLARCRDDVAGFERAVCEQAPNEQIRQECNKNIAPCVRGGEMCKFLACMDASMGNMSDGRVKMMGK